MWRRHTNDQRSTFSHGKYYSNFSNSSMDCVWPRFLRRIYKLHKTSLFIMLADNANMLCKQRSNFDDVSYKTSICLSPDNDITFKCQDVAVGCIFKCNHRVFRCNLHYKSTHSALQNHSHCKSNTIISRHRQPELPPSTTCLVNLCTFSMRSSVKMDQRLFLTNLMIQDINARKTHKTNKTLSGGQWAYPPTLTTR